jgi:hypothetical protein
MHNLHLVVTKADSPIAACKNAESYISDYGTENNWRTICGAIDAKTDEKYICDSSGRYLPGEKDTVISLNNLIRNHIQGILKESFDFSKNQTHSYWYELINWAKAKKAVSYLGNPAEYNILEESFREWELDEFGVTHTDYEGKNIYIVFIDMHS